MSDQEQAEQPKIPRMTEHELREFVLGVADGRIFTDRHLAEGSDPHMVAMVFMPTAFGAFEGWTEEDLKDLGCIWEHLDKAGPRGVNGYPSFMSMHLMHREDWERALPAILKEQERRKSIEI